MMRAPHAAATTTTTTTTTVKAAATVIATTEVEGSGGSSAVKRELPERLFQLAETTREDVSAGSHICVADDVMLIIAFPQSWSPRAGH